ncbi:hypothetical protein BH10BAC3_BH10BAC3_24910 [soil metagenome]
MSKIYVRLSFIYQIAAPNDLVDVGKYESEIVKVLTTKNIYQLLKAARA